MSYVNISKYHQGEVILAPEPKGGAKGDEVPNKTNRELGAGALVWVS